MLSSSFSTFDFLMLIVNAVFRKIGNMNANNSLIQTAFVDFNVVWYNEENHFIKI